MHLTLLPSVTVCLCRQDLAGGMVVSDIQLISDKESIPHGYCYIAEHLEPSEYKHQRIFVCLSVLHTEKPSHNHHNDKPAPTSNSNLKPSP